MEVNIKEFKVLTKDTVSICFVMDGKEVCQIWETIDKTGNVVKLLSNAVISIPAEELPSILEEYATQIS